MGEKEREMLTCHKAARAAVFSIVVSALANPAWGQALNEDLNTVTGTGSKTVLNGNGETDAAGGWDDGVSGENSFGGTVGNAFVNPITAQGLPTGGVAGTGAGEISVTDVTFDTLNFNFERVSGTGGGVFLPAGNTNGFTPSFDDGLFNAGAFGGVEGGAVVNGEFVAEGITSGGVSDSSAARITVTGVQVNSGEWFGGLQFTMGPLPTGGSGGAAGLVNANFEDGGIAQPPQGWTAFGNAFQEADFPCEGSQHGKVFQTFSGGPNVSGIFQDIAATAGQTWDFSAMVAHRAGDALPAATTNKLVMRIEYLDGTNGVIEQHDTTVLTGASPISTCIPASIQAGPAPVGTAVMRPVFIFINTNGNFDGGAPLMDEASVTLVSGPPSLDLSTIGFTAQVKGETAGAGSVLGDYQLRIEDTDGDRLVFFGTADGTFQSIGGSLDMATEQNAEGINSNGAFNPNSGSFTVVVAFENGTWGTGGQLTVDNLLVTDEQATPASNWFAGLFWPGLSAELFDLSQAFLSADVKGDTIGGEYEVRVELFDVSSAGIDDNFDAVAGNNVVLIDFDSWSAATPGGNGCIEAFTPGIDPNIEGEGAFVGVCGDTVLFDGMPPSQLRARSCTSCGFSAGGAVEIRVDGQGVAFGSGTWFGGLTWGGQGLASTDLSQVTLSAKIRGTAAAGGGLGDYELRLEDAQGDRLFFFGTADGTFQNVGGTLDMASTGPALSGLGDGTFDLDSPSYTVVVAFRNETDFAGWAFGGVLTVDDLFITPAPVTIPIGNIAFNGVADGTFQTVGGFLTEANAGDIFGDFTEDFETATGIGGGIFADSSGVGPNDNYDDGLEGENAFFGTFGGAVLDGRVAAEGCTTCGVGGSAGARLIIEEVVPNAGGWFSGLSWPGQQVDLTDLTQVTLTADVKVTTNGPGQMPGTVVLRLEDDEIDFREFVMAADGTFQSMGGTLDTATPGGVGQGNGVLDLDSSSYSVVVILVGDSTNWGAGATVTVDNLFLTGRDLSNVNSFTVTTTFANELDTWGTSGSLTVDNLFFSKVANVDGDQDLDLIDFAYFQECVTGSGGGVPLGCEAADQDDDNDIDVDDYNIFFTVVGPPE